MDSESRRTVLAVDDKPENLRVLIGYLEDSGYEIMVAQSGEEALANVKSVMPDIVLLDVLMPGIDGYETCRRLKRDADTRDVPVIFMTALSATTDKVRGFEVGGVDYLTKPLQHQEVLARVNAHMTIREYQQKLGMQNDLLQQKNNLLEARENELKESEARFKGLSEATFEGVLIHRNGQIVDTDSTLCEIAGREPSEMIGHQVIEFLPPEFHDAVRERLDKNETSPWEALAKKKDGTLLPIEMQSKTMPYKGEEVRVVAVRDLTWRKAMEAEKERIQRENLSFSMDTLRFVTHELKSPLAAMQSIVTVMVAGLAGDVPEKVEYHLNRIRRNCEELQDMVKNYLEFSRAGMENMVAQKRPGNFYKDVVAPCVEQTQILFDSRSIALDVDCPADLDVDADFEKIRVALSNYLTNAAKYGAEKSASCVAARGENGRILATVSNEGAGFTNEEKDSLFLKFSRLKNPNTKGKRGSGLGLYLAKHMVELHGGEVWAESVAGKSATFGFSLPCRVACRKAEDE